MTSELQSQQDIIEEQSNVSEFTADLGRKLELLQDLWVRAQDTCKNLETEMAAAMDVVPPQPDYRYRALSASDICIGNRLIAIGCVCTYVLIGYNSDRSSLLRTYIKNNITATTQFFQQLNA